MTEGKKPGDRARKSSGRGQRDLRVRVKSAKGRKLSSTLWLERQLNDPYVARAKREGYRGRAAYKILELDDKYRFLVPGARVMFIGTVGEFKRTLQMTHPDYVVLTGRGEVAGAAAGPGEAPPPPPLSWPR